MEIRAFTPIVFTKDDSGVISQMEALGFEKKHVKDGTENTDVVSTIMKDKNDHSLCLVQSAGFPQTFTGIRIMVDNFEEALEEFTKLGYTNIQERKGEQTGFSVATLLRSPEGLFVSVAEHFK